MGRCDARRKKEEDEEATTKMKERGNRLHLLEADRRFQTSQTDIFFFLLLLLLLFFCWVMQVCC